MSLDDVIYGLETLRESAAEVMSHCDQAFCELEQENPDFEDVKYHLQQAQQLSGGVSTEASAALTKVEEAELEAMG